MGGEWQSYEFQDFQGYVAVQNAKILIHTHRYLEMYFRREPQPVIRNSTAE